MLDLDINDLSERQEIRHKLLMTQLLLDIPVINVLFVLHVQFTELLLLCV